MKGMMGIGEMWDKSVKLVDTDEMSAILKSNFVDGHARGPPWQVGEILSSFFLSKYVQKRNKRNKGTWHTKAWANIFKVI